jgi:uncharacterized protein YeaO (DUF488 family)
MTLHVHTARLSYAGPGRLDITRSAVELDPFTPGFAFAPSRVIVGWVKRGVIEWEGTPGSYVELYTREMRESYRRHRGVWDALLALDEVTLVCFCVNPARCHRTLLAALLVKLGAVYEGERTDGQGSLPGVG